MEVKYINHMGDDLSVVNAARVSFSKLAEQYSQEQNERLINYLASHDHHSPFNHTFISLHVKAPIFVARQLVKHEYMPWNEVSRRYVDDEPEFYYPDVWRERAENKKQGSGDYLPVGIDSVIKENHVEFLELCFNHYRSLLGLHVAPEQARMVLPLNTYTEWYWSGTLHAWAKMYNLRAKSDAQRETQQVALKCGEIIEPLFPVSWEALCGRN